uniref:Uncharacterized protein n=1 Tax=Rhizophora mucronata TaxID=61149 RepID=A0A2P2L6G3_RHIMU
MMSSWNSSRPTRRVRILFLFQFSTFSFCFKHTLVSWLLDMIGF